MKKQGELVGEWLANEVYGALIDTFPEIKTDGVPKFFGESFIEERDLRKYTISFYHNTVDGKKVGVVKIIDTSIWPKRDYPPSINISNLNQGNISIADEIINDIKRERFPKCNNAIRSQIIFVNDSTDDYAGLYSGFTNSIAIDVKQNKISNLVSDKKKLRLKAEAEFKSTLTHELCHAQQVNKSFWKYFVNIKDEYWGEKVEILTEAEALLRGMWQDIQNGGTAGYYASNWSKKDLWVSNAMKDWKTLQDIIGISDSDIITDGKKIRNCLLLEKNFKRLNIVDKMMKGYHTAHAKLTFSKSLPQAIMDER